MNSIDEQLNRLFRAAGPCVIDTLPPFGLSTRVLAAWSVGVPVNVWSTALLIRGLIVACVIMLLSFCPLLKKESSPASEYLQLADSTLQMSNNP